MLRTLTRCYYASRHQASGRWTPMTIFLRLTLQYNTTLSCSGQHLYRHQNYLFQGFSITSQEREYFYDYLSYSIPTAGPCYRKKNLNLLCIWASQWPLLIYIAFSKRSRNKFMNIFHVYQGNNESDDKYKSCGQ